MNNKKRNEEEEEEEVNILVFWKETFCRKTFGLLVTFWFGTFGMLFAPLGMLLVMKTLEDGW